VIALTNLHNPSSELVEEATLRKIVSSRADVGARVLVDEVYLEAMFENSPPSPFCLSRVCGDEQPDQRLRIERLRCGWILAEAEVAKEIRRLDDIFAATRERNGATQRGSAKSTSKDRRTRESDAGDQSRNVNSFLRERDDIELCRHNSAQLLFRGCATAMWTNFATHCSKNTRRPWCPAAFSNHRTTFV